MLREFSGDLSRVMLFLRNIAKIAIYEWVEGSNSPRLLDEAVINNLTPEIQAKRSLSFASFGSNNSRALFAVNGKGVHETGLLLIYYCVEAHLRIDLYVAGVPCDYMLNIKISHGLERQAEDFRFLISNQLGGGECAKIANDPLNSSQRLVPWGGVAVLLPSQDNPDYFQPLTGMAFCFLPLPTLTYLPIHVSSFALALNKNNPLCSLLTNHLPVEL